ASRQNSQPRPADQLALVGPGQRDRRWCEFLIRYDHRRGAAVPGSPGHHLLDRRNTDRTAVAFALNGDALLAFTSDQVHPIVTGRPRRRYLITGGPELRSDIFFEVSAIHRIDPPQARYEIERVPPAPGCQLGKSKQREKQGGAQHSARRSTGRRPPDSGNAATHHKRGLAHQSRTLDPSTDIDQMV